MRPGATLIWKIAIWGNGCFPEMMGQQDIQLSVTEEGEVWHPELGSVVGATASVSSDSDHVSAELSCSLACMLIDS